MIGILCIGICAVDITCLTLIREPENVKHVEPLNIRKAIQMPLTDQNYRNILIFFLLWSVASNFASPFFSIYMLENLGLSYFYITVMNMVASVARIAAANLWGRQQTVVRGGWLRWGPFLCWELHISAGDC